MTWTYTLPELPTTLSGKFASFVKNLSDAVYACSMPGGFLTHAMYSIINGWIFKHVVRIRLLIVALQAGTVRTRQSPQAELTRARAANAGGLSLSAFLVSRRFAWLARMMHNNGRSLPTTWLQSLVDEPEMLELMATSPRLVRTLKPLCRSLGIDLPKLPKPTPPPPANEKPADAEQAAAGLATSPDVPQAAETTASLDAPPTETSFFRS